MHDDGGKLGADTEKLRSIKKKRKKHRVKVVEIEKTERSQESKSNSSSNIQIEIYREEKGHGIGRKTFAKKLFGNLEDDDEWKEAGDQLMLASADEAINYIIQFDEDEYAAEMDVQPCEENLPA
ncbi:hypothetical protein KFK09_006091 [Dendrobium nobile]|uniref:Uncharacterized protein n=1 Tax=Dendrobium nobile TaxID=94219 RepID=A0A8T3BMX8_DENNO|nr:hypothetical protein KFK09_006091 [Dendrobium nobile]